MSRNTREIWNGLRDINKRYIDDVLNYYIKEMYSWQYFEYKSASERDIEVMLNKRLELLNDINIKCRTDHDTFIQFSCITTFSEIKKIKYLGI